MNNEDCIHGDECAIHNRIDQIELDDTTEKLISYVGEYAVVTEVAAETVTPGARLAIALGLVVPENMYRTTVGFLGDKETSLHDSRDTVSDDDFYRYWVAHNDADNLVTAHLMVVDGVSNGVIDVSVPKGKEYNAELQEISDNLRFKAIARSGGDVSDY